MKKSVALALVVGSGLFTGTAWAATDGSVLLPNTFTAGSPAQASEVNANFAALQNAANASNTRLTTAEGSITNHTNAINYLAASVATNTTDIASKQTRVSGYCPTGYYVRVINSDGTVVCQADTGGGVTGVTAGSGLSGGGTTGDVTLFIPNGGITASHIAPGSVGSLAIADGAIASGNIAAGAVGSAAIADGSVTAVKIADEPGIEFSSASSVTRVMNICNTPPNTITNLDSVTVDAPASGFIYVSASGEFCTKTANVSSWLGMDDAPAGTYTNSDGGNSVYDVSTTARGCTQGEPYTHYAFQNVYTVAAGSHTYYLNGCVSSAGQTTQLNNHPMIAMFFPTRY